MKRLIKTILPFCLSVSLSYAGTMGPVAMEGTWTVGAGALGLQPALANQFVYAVINTTNPTGTTEKVLNPVFSWGVDVFLRRNLNATGRDISASYMGFWSSSTGSVTLPLSSNYVYTNFYQTASGKNISNVNSADILGGQNIMLNDVVRLHGALGVGFTNLFIKNSISNDQGLGIRPNISNQSYIATATTFNGEGPKVGVDGEYLISDRYPFSLVGGASAALLLGSQHTTNINTIYGNVDMNAITTNITNINSFIGLRYHANTRIPIIADVGYKAYAFINEISLGGVYLSLATTF